ncbi:hypothetical protein [Nocardioides sp. TF02-7]|uniref:hypothetical protein n=1 Tax=Nocardioides sp. TF02-7 TaxID=2917724 RepID=UPI001F05EB16|nr:hypothetical protein [Nocardioides sp. TF02-7]UMG94597.1 hypothetical protein MF408_11970 [Nocardioides sp. TF02-7]
MEPAWAEGDLRPDPLVDPCARITATTLRTLGFERAAGLPPPLGCTWVEGARVLTVRVDVHRPGDGTTAVRSAEQAVADGLAAATYEELRPPIGDAAWQWSTATVGTTEHEDLPGTTSTAARLLVRRANVVVHAALADSDPLRAGDGRLPIAGTDVQSGLRAAVEETLAAWDGPTPTGRAGPPEGTDGPVTALPSPCRVLAADVRALLPAAEPLDRTAPGENRLRGCRWQPRPYGELVEVTAYAVGPNGISGADAESEAEAVMAAGRRPGADRGLGGPWDEAALSGADDGYHRDAWRLAVRSDNLVLVVQVSFAGRAGGRALPTAVGLARSYLADASG